MLVLDCSFQGPRIGVSQARSLTISATSSTTLQGRRDGCAGVANAAGAGTANSGCGWCTDLPTRWSSCLQRLWATARVGWGLAPDTRSRRGSVSLLSGFAISGGIKDPPLLFGESSCGEGTRRARPAGVRPLVWPASELESTVGLPVNVNPLGARDGSNLAVRVSPAASEVLPASAPGEIGSSNDVGLVDHGTDLPAADADEAALVHPVKLRSAGLDLG